MGKAGAGLQTVAQVAAASGSLSVQPWQFTGHTSILVWMVPYGHGKDRMLAVTTCTLCCHVGNSCCVGLCCGLHGPTGLELTGDTVSKCFCTGEGAGMQTVIMVGLMHQTSYMQLVDDWWCWVKACESFSLAPC